MSATPDLRALLLTDVVDSTRLTEELGDNAMAGLWTVHDRVARDLLPLWRGREIDKTDGMLLLFDDVRDAVGYALAYHRGLAERALPFKARAGIHVGPVSLRPNPPEDVARGAKPVEVDGIALPIAARVMSVALGAQTLLSADARLALGVAALRVMSHGHWRMHGVTDPVELFEVGEAGAAPFATPPDGQKVYRVARQGELWQPVREVRHSIPAERDSFVGRQEPLHVLAQKFDDGARLVSVLGMGGTGKTRLVTRFAWTGLGDYPGGVWFCDLSQARTIDGIHFAVAQGLDVPLGKTDPVVQLAHAIAGRGRCLIILDNFEQVARFAEEALGRWLDRAPLAQFLVTTREVLGIVGEQVLALAPLALPDAAALFRRRAESGHQAYAPTADDVLAIHELVTVLDGLPLAIELAAARVRVMPPRTLLARMSERFDVLLSRTGRQDRQATLRAAFDWSWELLSEAEKAALAQLSVFEGGFTLASAQAVLDFSALPAHTVRAADSVQWLADKSFVRPLANDRFDLLESVREYAAEHLRTEGRYPGSGPSARLGAETRHGAYFAAVGSKRASVRGFPDIDNLVAACRRAAARGDGPVAVAALTAASGPIRLRGPFRIGVQLTDAVRTIANLDAATSVELTLLRAFSLQLCGAASEARQEFASAEAGARSNGDRHALARALNGVASLQAQDGQIEAAGAAYDEALAITRGLGERLLECNVLNNLGGFCEATGRAREAQGHYEAALILARQAGDRRWEGGSAGNLGQWLANQGRTAEARPLYTQAVAIAQELGDRQWEANARCNLGLLHHAEGNLDAAQVELQTALTFARELGHARLLSIVCCNLGLVAEALGEPEKALACFDEAVAMAHDLGDRRSKGQFLTYLGSLHARQSRFAEARDCLAAGGALLRAVGDSTSLGILLCALVETEHLAGRTTAALAASALAIELADQAAVVPPNSEFGQALRRVDELLSVARHSSTNA